MSERRQCEFQLVRYVPDLVKNEFVNIGVMLREAGRPESTAVRFTRDWTRVRCIDPDADVEMLEALEAEMERRLREQAAEGVPILKTIDDSFSNLVQITEVKGCLSENVVAEMEQLMRLYVERQKRESKARVSGRQAILREMRMQFEHAGVWGLMRKRIAVSEYTRSGDPLRIDCGYRPNGVIRMFQAVSLDGDIDLAKVLAFGMSTLTEGVRRVEAAKLELTAIVEPLAKIARGSEQEDREAMYRFGVETMEAQAIRVLTASDLPRVAETARFELRV